MMAREDDDRGSVRQPVSGADDLEAVQAVWKSQIQNHHVEGVAPEPGEGGWAIGGAHDVVALEAQDLCEWLAALRVVLDDEHPRSAYRHCVPPTPATPTMGSQFSAHCGSGGDCGADGDGRATARVTLATSARRFPPAFGE